MGWHKLGSKTLSEAGDNIDLNIDTQESYQIMFHSIDSGDMSCRMRLNSDSGSNYARRGSNDGATDFTSTSSTDWGFEVGGAGDEFVIGYITDNDGEEVLAITFTVDHESAGASIIPRRKEHVAKYINSGITKMSGINVGTGDLAVNSNLSIIGTTDDLDKVTQ